MPIAIRTAQTTWEGPLASGTGTVRMGSGAAGELPVTWASRTEHPGGKTSPEELAAPAHGACYATALALRLGERKAAPERLAITATVTLDESGASRRSLERGNRTGLTSVVGARSLVPARFGLV